MERRALSGFFSNAYLTDILTSYLHPDLNQSPYRLARPREFTLPSTKHQPSISSVSTKSRVLRAALTGLSPVTSRFGSRMTTCLLVKEFSRTRTGLVAMEPLMRASVSWVVSITRVGLVLQAKVQLHRLPIRLRRPLSNPLMKFH